MNIRLLLAAAALPMACFGSVSAQEIAVRHFEPAPIRIKLDELPKPYATPSVDNAPRVVQPPKTPALETPPGFRVAVFAEVPKARWLALTPAGDVLCAASRENRVVLLRDRDGDGVAEGYHPFVDESRGANLPFGMAFTEGHFYLGNTDAVLRYPCRPTDDSAGAGLELGRPRTITRLPGQGYHQHWTRNVVVSPDGQKLYVTVGSASNVDIEKLPRASVLQMNLDGSDRKVFAWGLRNPVGLDFHPRTGALYAAINERDELGDDLVPDYLALVREGEFYGWPYAYLAPEYLDPRHMVDGKSVRPELAARTQTPEVLFESHSAALGLAFYTGDAFPQRYRNGAMVAFRGSWNRDRGTGYKVVFVPFDDQGRAQDYYEDFVRGFLLDPSVPETWGRPVGVLVLPDGSLLFTEEGNGRVYRVWYEG